MQGVYSKVKSIEPDGVEDVYCLYVPDTNNFLTNGIVSHNCDALRYAIMSHKVNIYDPYKQTEIVKDWNVNKYNVSRNI